MEIDLADRLDDLICTFDKAVNDGPSDIFIAIIGWLVFAGGIFLVVGYIINNLRSTLSPATSVSTLDEKVNGSTKDDSSKDETNSSRYIGTPNDFEYNVSINTKEESDNIKTSTTTSNNELSKASVSKNEAFEQKKNFEALDPPVFPKTRSNKNESISADQDEISKPSGLANGNSNIGKEFLSNGKDSIENEVISYLISYNIYLTWQTSHLENNINIIFL